VDPDPDLQHWFLQASILHNDRNILAYYSDSVNMKLKYLPDVGTPDPIMRMIIVLVIAY
jgi:hypothetical protein